MAKDEKTVIGIVDNLRLCWDGAHNWTVERVGKNQKTGEPTYRVEGYYPKLEGACERILRCRINAEVKGELQDILETIERCKREVLTMLKGIEGTPARGCVTLDDMPEPADQTEDDDWGDSGGDDGADW